MLDVTRETFAAEVLESEAPVLVDFWATWCGPCRMIAPVLASLDAETGDKLKIVKVDIDTQPELTAEYEISSVPTLMLFKNGEVVEVQNGAIPRPALIKVFGPHYE